LPEATPSRPERREAHGKARTAKRREPVREKIQRPDSPETPQLPPLPPRPEYYPGQILKAQFSRRFSLRGDNWVEVWTKGKLSPGVSSYLAHVHNRLASKLECKHANAVQNSVNMFEQRYDPVNDITWRRYGIITRERGIGLIDYAICSIDVSIRDSHGTEWQRKSYRENSIVR